MKIAFLNIYNGLVERGAEVAVLELARKLAQADQIDIFQGGEDTTHPLYGLEKPKLRTITKHPYMSMQESPTSTVGRFLRRFYLDINSLVIFLFTIRCLPNFFKNSYDWVIPINGGWQVVILRFMRFFLRFKLLITGHAGVGFDDWWNITIGNPDIFVALSPKAYRWAEHQSRSKIEYIPDGINLDRFNPFVSPVKVLLENPIIFCNAALLPYKRVYYTIDAVAGMHKGSLLLVGDGPLRKTILAYAQKKLPAHRFYYTSKVFHEEMPSYYCASSVFTLVSDISEAFGLVYLEALACNRPIVTRDDENRRVIIGDAGIYVSDVSNAKEYTRALEEACRKKFAEIPRQQAMKFSWDIIAQRYQELLRK